MPIILLALLQWNKFPDKYKTLNQTRGKEFNGNDEVVVIFHQLLISSCFFLYI
jgi:hypothetical protein